MYKIHHAILADFKSICMLCGLWFGPAGSLKFKCYDPQSRLEQLQRNHVCYATEWLESITLMQFYTVQFLQLTHKSEMIVPVYTSAW